MNKIKNFLKRLIQKIKMETSSRILYVREEDIPLTKTRKVFLKSFLKNRPRTYYKNNKIQCDPNSNRSISELIYIVRSRFPVTSEESVIRILAEINMRNECHIIWCTQVNKFVVVSGYKDKKNNFISNYSRKYYGEKTGVDGISYDNLIKIRNLELSL